MSRLYAGLATIKICSRSIKGRPRIALYVPQVAFHLGNVDVRGSKESGGLFFGQHRLDEPASETPSGCGVWTNNTGMSTGFCYFNSNATIDWSWAGTFLHDKERGACVRPVGISVTHCATHRTHK